MIILSNKTKYYLNGKRPDTITDNYAKTKFGISGKIITRIDVCFIKNNEYTDSFENGSIMNNNYSGVEKCKSFKTHEDAVEFCNRIVEKRKNAILNIMAYIFTRVVLNKKYLACLNPFKIILIFY